MLPLCLLFALKVSFTESLLPRTFVAAGSNSNDYNDGQAANKVSSHELLPAAAAAANVMHSKVQQHGFCFSNVHTVHLISMMCTHLGALVHH